jgi:hypothetical protein
MFSNTRRIWITCIVLVLIACLCVGILLASGVGVYLFSQPLSSEATPVVVVITPKITPTPLVPNQVTPISTVTQTINDSVTASPTPLSNPTSDLEILNEMDQIQSQVESYRGLSSNIQVDRSLLTSEQLKEKVVTDFLGDYTQEDARIDVAILSAFGFLPADFDFFAFQKGFLEEQVAGYYDDLTKQMYVVTDQGLDGLSKLTYAHEYTHFLQDQAYDLQNGLGLTDEDCLADSERCAAVTALIEGDAVLSETYWYTFFSSSLDQQQIEDFYQTYSSPIYDNSPAYYQEDSLFPYTQGLDFVISLYTQGGWDAVNQAYLNPPVTTEQILHPEDYPDELPVSVDLPDISSTLGQGWTQIDSSTVGEWYTYLLLEAGYDSATRLTTAIAQTAAAGWGGDAYRVYQNDLTGQVVLVVSWVWDTSGDAVEFGTAFVDYGNTRWSSPTASVSGTTRWETDTNTVIFTETNQSTTWILAPDGTTADSIARILLP